MRPQGAVSVVDQPVTRVAGDDRIDTGIAASRVAFPSGGARGAVIARSDDFADALVGAPLAAVVGPLLLTRGAHLDPRVRAELQRVLVPWSRVFILGTVDVIAAEVQRAIEQLGDPVTRLGGADRYETAAAIARHLQPHADPNSGCRFVPATGTDFPDPPQPRLVHPAHHHVPLAAEPCVAKISIAQAMTRARRVPSALT